MDIFSAVLYPVLAIGGMGLLFGLGLGYAGKVLSVPQDERVGRVRDALPGANCGGCGFAGCDAYAAAVAAGEAKVNACSVGGADVIAKIAEIMGVEAEAFVRKTAYVKCRGHFDAAEYRYEYVGINDCRAAEQLAGGGSKTCRNGCLGHGSCVAACAFGAISVKNGVAVVDKDKCTQCGACVGKCPRNLIELVPDGSTVRVECNSTELGKNVRLFCQVGCIACKLCEKACEYDAIHVENNIAHVDYDKCVKCGACVAKCPRKIIREV